MTDVKKAKNVMGREPLNPIGQCFESAGYQFVIGGKENNPDDGRLCHGIGIANFPGQEGLEIGHAWVEGEGMALDTTWGITVPIAKYRAMLQISHVVEYTFEEAKAMWEKYKYPGPWDEKVKAVVEERKEDVRHKQAVQSGTEETVGSNVKRIH